MEKPQAPGLSDSTLSALWRRAVLKRCGYRCVVCQGKGTLQIHHVIHRRYKMLRWYVVNGVPVCPGECHEKVNFMGVSILEDDERDDVVGNAQITFKQFLVKWGMTESEWRTAVKDALLKEINA